MIGGVNTTVGIAVFCCNLHSHNQPYGAELEKLLGVKVMIENDANCAALGEAFAGAAKDCKSCILITIGTGIGGGIVLDRKIYTGNNGGGAELGHIVMVYDGLYCNCGRNGCWESYASATALISQTKQAMQENPDSVMWKLCEGDIENVNGKTAFDAAKQGDAAGEKVVKTYIDYLACGLTSVTNIFQPEVICIGGGVSNQGEYITEPLEKIIHRDVYAKIAPWTRVRRAALGNDAGIIGAAVLGVDI